MNEYIFENIFKNLKVWSTFILSNGDKSNSNVMILTQCLKVFMGEPPQK